MKIHDIKIGEMHRFHGVYYRTLVTDSDRKNGTATAIKIGIRIARVNKLL